MTLFQRLIRIRRKVVFRKPKGCVGLCEFGKGARIFVALKARRISPAQIYLHELIHALYPKWPEKKVLAMERYLWKRLTPHQRYLLYRKLFLHQFTTEEGE